MNLIDLDRPPAAPGPRRVSRRAARAAALLLAGAVFGGAATYCWAVRRPAELLVDRGLRRAQGGPPGGGG